MRVLVLGATGFIGPHIVRQLVEKGHDVAIFHRGTSSPELPEVHRFEGDRNALPELRGAFARWAPDLVIDLIAFTAVQADQLIDTFEGVTARLVVLSSADVYRNYDGFRGHPSAAPDPTPLTETSPLRERLYPYRGLGVAFPDADNYEKILVERRVLGSSDPGATVVRLPAVYGPGDKQDRLRDLIARMDDSRPTILLGKRESAWRWSRGYVENVAAAVIHTGLHPEAAGGVYNVSDEPALTELEWLQRIGRQAGWTGKVLLVDDEDLRDLKPDFDWSFHLAIDAQQLEEGLGFTPAIDPAEAVRRTIEWTRAHAGDADPTDYAAEDLVLARLGSEGDAL